VPERWCTVTVVDADGRRHSLDLQAASSFDAAHIYICHVKEHPERGLPRPTLATVFEVAIDGVPGGWKGPAAVDHRAAAFFERAERLSLQPAADAGVGAIR
jgi:hypothetical protein